MPPQRSGLAATERRPPGRAEIIGLLERHGVRPSRALGQNFLADPNVAERIVRVAGVAAGDHVLEIGPGVGSLTVALAASGAHVVAVELDRHLMPALAEVTEGLPVHVVQGDAMTADFGELLRVARSWTLVANLPYNIATPLVLDLLERQPAIARMLVMVQREVGERLAAAPRSPAFGAVSVRLAYFATARVVMRVPASVFVPRPKVESVVVEVVRRSGPAVPAEVAGWDEVTSLVGLGFAHRRQMLRRTLSAVAGPGAFDRAGIAPSARPEELGIEEWGRLAKAVRATGAGA
jgi:16S rRNA (adenine1518-N6/adenine1519-N6)-dimethyltransferase